MKIRSCAEERRRPSQWLHHSSINAFVPCPTHRELCQNLQGGAGSPELLPSPWQDVGGPSLMQSFCRHHSCIPFLLLSQSFCTFGDVTRALQQVTQLSYLRLSPGQSLFLSTLTSMGLCSHHCPLQKEASLSAPDPSLTCGHKQLFRRKFDWRIMSI